MEKNIVNMNKILVGIDGSEGAKLALEKANQLLKDTIKEFSNYNIKINGIIEEGDAAEKIIDTALKLNVDLIMLGSRGASKIGVYAIGSIANKVVQYAHKPVMIVR
jgi:nucleotide-binding universal stress UspA family protein